jgi:hypothetical protein
MRARRLWLLVMLLAGCASEPRVPPGVIDLTGTWDGEWNGGAIGAGRIAMVLQQSGDRVTGDLAISGVPAISATDGRLDGRVNGHVFRFNQPAGVVEAELEIRDRELIGQSTGRLRMALRLTRQP